MIFNNLHLFRIRPRGAEQQRAIGGGLGAAVGGAGGLPTFDFSRIQIPSNLGLLALPMIDR